MPEPVVADTPAWHADHPCLSENPEASKAYSKYADVNAGLAGGHEAMKKVGRPFWLPDSHEGLTDVQKGEIRANVAKMNKAPETPDGYVPNLPTGAIVDDQVISELKAYGHARGWSQEDFQGAIDLQMGFVARINKATDETIGARIKTGFDQYSKEVGGDASAALRMDWVQKHLKSFAVDEKGNFDETMWNGFVERNFYNNQGKELILMRALAPYAQEAVGTGGAPAGGQPANEHAGALSYPEMSKK